MPLSRSGLWAGSVVAALIVAIFAGCDLPTEGPSVQTDVTMSTPLVAEKTFSFLGGPQSEHEPLVDTTTSSFDSLFTVGGDPKDITIEQEIDNFEVGGLDGALESAAQDVGLDTSLSESIVQESSLLQQDIGAEYREQNGTFESEGGTAGPAPVVDRNGDDEVQIPFPTSVLEPPTSGVVDASGASVTSVVLSNESQNAGRTVNRLTFTLENQGPETLTDGDMGAPTIALVNTATGAEVATASFGRRIPSASSETARMNVASQTLGEGKVFQLQVDGAERPGDARLTTEVSRLRYRAATLTNLDEVALNARQENISTVGANAARFAGLVVDRGEVDIDVENNLSFPIALDRVTATNNPSALTPLPPDFPALDLDEQGGQVNAGGTATLTSDLDGRGIARAVDVELSASPASGQNEITVRSGNGLRIVTEAEPTIDAMYFWPNGEQVAAQGTFQFQQERLDFARSDDFVELGAGTIRLNNLISELGVSFERFTLSYSGIRRPNYGRADSLVIRFDGQTAGPGRFEFAGIERGDAPRDLSAPLEGLQIRAVNNTLQYQLEGTLETIPSRRIPEAEPRVIRQGDEVKTGVQVQDLDVRALRARVRPFTVPVTPDENGDGRLDVGRDAEAVVASFEGLGGLASRVDGIQFSGASLGLSVDTDVGADAQLYGVFQGRTAEQGPVYLAGKGQQSVAASDTIGEDFRDDGRSLSSDRLLQLGIEGAPSGQTVTQTTELTSDNSTVDAFISALPSSVRFAGKVLMTGGRLRLRRPVTFETGIDVQVPLRFKSDFVVRDTIDTGFDGLDDLTDPEKTVTVSEATLRFNYTNGVPLGADVTLTVVDEQGASLVEFTPSDDGLRIDPAPKNNSGAAEGTASGTAEVRLSEETLRDMAEGEAIRVRLRMTQADGAAARTRADDTMRFSLGTDIDASVQSNE